MKLNQKKRSLLLLLCLVMGAFLSQSKAQIIIGSDSDPDVDAVLELVSNDNLGLLLPRVKLTSLTDPTPLSAHKAGMVLYNVGNDVDENGNETSSDALPPGYYYNDGFQWIQITDTNIASWRSITTKDAATSNMEDIYQSGAVVVGASALESKTQFAVVSTDKGILLPRMTTQERDNMGPANEIPDGLMIYNITTHCYNYFNAAAGTGGDWVSLCGTQDPATFELSDCSGTISPDPSSSPSSYKVGVPLTSDNTYSINVRVTQAGTYNILLMTDNGYSFSKAGVFTQAGVIATIALEGQGVPVRESLSPGDTPYLQFNGMTVTPSCPGGTSLPVIPVTGTSARYTLNCNSLTLGSGSYKKGEVVNPAQHYVEVEIAITQDGIATIEAVPEGDANGIAFRSDPIDMQTSVSPQVVRLYASGVPVNNGTFNYKIGDCTPFSITVASDMGSFNTPAKSCYEIYADDNTKTDGEYWIQVRNGSRDAVKTFCDMTNGGYTLVWSFSEKTLRETYHNAGATGMSMYASGLYLSANKPLNVVSVESGEINYFNYRLAGSTMQNVKQSPTVASAYKVRIAYDPKKVDDYWALENFMDIRPQSVQYDLLASTAGNSYTWSGNDVKATGKLFNLEYNQTNGNTVLYGGTTNTGLMSAFYYGRTPYVNHWDAGFRLKNTTLQTEVSQMDGTKYSMNVNPHHFDNIFGALDEDEITHHIGKCVSPGSSPDTVNDYGDATSRCAYIYRFPHSFNGGEGRIIQWFVK